ncbi:geminin coiled-coil domain-containing protein 1 [Hippoglossus stenolepis]|uniref:geminin coiled-coil domain-containing protein 1 n=1 Tax=Hippoglossus stenolepis TaxID=195615 RepID=UPI00159C6022|nr:geminin coiled-coil domain-containing protein 1 [Hippoglossus stenolepis]
METLAPVWAHDPCDLSDLREKQQAPATEWESHCVFSCSPPAARVWTEQLSPHIQRNKQLRDVLLQREEELVRLQEENNKLREFLSSSFVRRLEEKAKKLTADGRRKLKRNLMYVNDEESLQARGHQLTASPQVSKRACRNLTAEFSSESSQTSAVSSEPNLDLWVLRTLGLKDRDTIDTSNESLSSPGHSLRSSVYDATVTSSSSSGYTLNSLSPSAAAATHSSAHSFCQSSTLHTEYMYNAAKSQEVNCGNPAESSQNCTTSPGQRSDFTQLSGRREAPAAVIRSHDTLTNFQSPLRTENFTKSPDRAEICSITSSRTQSLVGHPADRPASWSSLEDSQTPSEGTNQFGPLVKIIIFSPVSSSSPVQNRPCPPAPGCSPTSPSAGSQPAAAPQTPRSRTDLAFTMSLSPSSSVKTHSFPQGQAFVSKDTDGRWNFTWLPRQGP